MLAEWPKAKELREQEGREVRAALGSLHVYNGHVVVFSAYRRIHLCLECGKFARRRATLAGQSCAALDGELRSRVQMACSASHSLVSVTGPAFAGLLMCVKCGCYSETAFRNLRRPCRGRLSGQLAKVRRVELGWHPRRRIRVTGVHRVLPGLAALRASSPADVPEGPGSAPAGAEPEPAGAGAQPVRAAGFDDPDWDPMWDLPDGGGSSSD